MREELEDYFCKFTFGQFITLAILELATLFFVFYMGARYGPELFNRKSETALREELIVPDGEPKTVEEIVGKSGYSYPETLSDQAAAPVQAQPEVKEPPLPEGVEIIRPEPPEPPPTVLVKAPPPPPAPKKETPIKRAALKSEYKFSVQVGSYQTANDASMAIDRWRAKGYDAFMSIGEIPNRGTWYRVRVGGYDSRGEAEKATVAFKTKEKVPAFVVLADT